MPYPPAASDDLAGTLLSLSQHYLKEETRFILEHDPVPHPISLLNRKPYSKAARKDSVHHLVRGAES